MGHHCLETLTLLCQLQEARSRREMLRQCWCSLQRHPWPAWSCPLSPQHPPSALQESPPAPCGALPRAPVRLWLWYDCSTHGPCFSFVCATTALVTAPSHCIPLLPVPMSPSPLPSSSPCCLPLTSRSLSVPPSLHPSTRTHSIALIARSPPVYSLECGEG